MQNQRVENKNFFLDCLDSNPDLFAKVQTFPLSFLRPFFAASLFSNLIVYSDKLGNDDRVNFLIHSLVTPTTNPAKVTEFLLYSAISLQKNEEGSDTEGPKMPKRRR